MALLPTLLLVVAVLSLRRRGAGRAGLDTDDQSHTRARLGLVSVGGLTAAPLPLLDVEQIRLQVAEAEKAGDEEKLAALYLQLGEQLYCAGKNEDGANAARKCISFSIKSENLSVHARGRLVLAQVAADKGDNGGACEQWQLARELFDKAGMREDRKAVDEQMHRCECPTDWLLTEF